MTAEAIRTGATHPVPSRRGRTSAPEPAIPSHAHTDLLHWLDGCVPPVDPAVVEARELRDHCRKAGIAPPVSHQSRLIAEFLQQLGYGVEPDVRFGGITLASAYRAAIFRLQEGSPGTPSGDFLRAREQVRVALNAAALLGRADTDWGTAHLHRLQRTGRLTPGERQRLDVFLLRESQIVDRSTASLPHPAVAHLYDADERSLLTEWLRGHAATHRRGTKTWARNLERVCRVLGIDQGAVLGGDPRFTREGTPKANRPATEPVTIRSGTARRDGIPIPPPPPSQASRPGTIGSSAPRGSSDRAGTAPPPPGSLGAASGRRRHDLVLDPALVERRIAESAQVSALLAGIFRDEESGVAVPAPSDFPTAAAASPTPPAPGIAGLDGTHSALLRAFAERPSWTRGEWEALCDRHRLLPEGALDTLNDAAIDRCGEPLAEGDDPIELTPHVLQELLA